MKKLRITIENKSYDVTVELLEGGAPLAPAPVRVSSPIVTASVSAPASTPAPAPRGDAAPGDVISPLAGKIVSVDVKVGDAVKEGAQVLTIEAMKMNTYIYAPKSGTVSAVSVAAGDGVQEGALLLKIS